MYRTLEQELSVVGILWRVDLVLVLVLWRVDLDLVLVLLRVNLIAAQFESNCTIWSDNEGHNYRQVAQRPSSGAFEDQKLDNISENIRNGASDTTKSNAMGNILLTSGPELQKPIGP